MRFASCPHHGFAKQGLRERRTALGWKGLAQIHHVVPRCLGDHHVVRGAGYDVEAAYNLILLPTREGTEGLRLRAHRPVHDGGHMAYNAFCLEGLQSCANTVDFLLLLIVLHRGSRGWIQVPWK